MDDIIIAAASTTTALTGVSTRRSESIAQLVGALAKARAAFGPVLFNREGKINPKDTSKQGFSYPYANLASINDATVAALSANGLVIFSDVIAQTEALIKVCTELHHESGEWRAVVVALPYYSNDSKNVGGALTYGRRFGQQLLLNIYAEEDNDDALPAGQTGAAQPAPVVQQPRAKDAAPETPKAKDAAPAQPDAAPTQTQAGPLAPEGMRRVVRAKLETAAKTDEAMLEKFGFSLDCMPAARVNDVIAWIGA